MPDQSPDLFYLILYILCENPAESLSLDELTKLALTRTRNYNNSNIEETGTDPKEQSIILDHLLKLDDLGLIILNPETDKSTITVAGQKKAAAPHHDGLFS